MIAELTEKSESYYECEREEMLEFIPRGSRKILDAGCGAGIFGRRLKDVFSTEVWGIEVNKSQAEKAGRMLDKVICGDIINSIEELIDGYFDCIVFNDTLEHLINPDDVLIKIKTKLIENGCIVASIPNVRYITNLKELIINKDWKYRSEGILDNTHLRFFTKKSIVRMFEDNGYEVVSIQGINKYGRSLLFSIFNILTFTMFSDARYLQFACVAKKKF